MFKNHEKKYFRKNQQTFLVSVMSDYNKSEKCKLF